MRTPSVRIGLGIVLVWLAGAAPAMAQSRAPLEGSPASPSWPRLTAGFSLDLTQYPDAKDDVTADGRANGSAISRRRSHDLRDTPTDIGGSVDYWVTPWLAAGFSWEGMGNVTVSEQFEFEGFADASQVFDRSFDAQSVDVVVKPAWSIGDMTRVFGIAGVLKWWGESTARGELTVFDNVLDSFSVRQSDGGVTGVFGAGVIIWPTDLFGFSAYYKQTRLKDAGSSPAEITVDERFRKVGLSVRFRLWGR